MEYPMKSIIGFVLYALLLTGCTQQYNVLGAELLKVKLVDYDPPKHFYVTVEVIGTNSTAEYHTEIGTKFDRIWVSKHCSGISRDKIGTIFTVPVIRYQSTDQDDTEIKYDFDTGVIRQVLCR